MSLKIGIVGLPNVGKSTLFKALTKKPVDIQNYPFTTIEPNIGIVRVPDERLEILGKISNSAKTIPAIIEFVDIAGLVKGAAQGEGLGNQFLSHIREVDAIAQVVRIFEDKNITHIAGAPDALRDIEIINLELALADLQTIEKTAERLEKEIKYGFQETAYGNQIILKAKTFLNSGKLLNNLDPKELNLIKNFNLLTPKPFIYVLNSDEKLLKDKSRISQIHKMLIDKLHLAPEQIIDVAIKLEQELDELNPKEAAEYKMELGLPNDLGLDKLIKTAYKILGLITFFTTGEDETRAWTIKSGSNAPQAGRAIHSDFQEKFIRADVINFKKFSQLDKFGPKAWQKAKELAQIQTVGKEYIVQDGDIIEFKI